MSGGSGTALPNWSDPIGAHNWGGGTFDPMNMYASNQPGGANYIAKNGAPVPTSLTPLSPQSTIPMMPGGAFMPIQPQQGIFNQMAANSAGQLFNPAMQNPANGANGAKGANGANGTNGQQGAATNINPTHFNGNVSYGNPGGLNKGYLKP